MTIELVILGMLIEEPRSAYDLQKDVENHHFERWTRISTPSVYKKVLQLEEAGYLAAEMVPGERRGNKAVYSITDAGVERFEYLMAELSNAAPTVIFDFNVLIANITKLPSSRSMELLHNLRARLQESLHSHQKWREEYADMPFNGRAIIDQQISVCRSLLVWLEEFEQQLHMDGRRSDSDE